MKAQILITKTNGLLHNLSFAFHKIAMIFVLFVMGFNLMAQWKTETQVLQEIAAAKTNAIINFSTSENYGNNKWFMVKKDSTTTAGVKYAFLVSEKFLSNGNLYKFNTINNNQYEYSTLRTEIRGCFESLPPVLKNISVAPNLGDNSKNARSVPTSTKGTAALDALFAPSYREMYDWNGGREYPLQYPLTSYVYATKRFWTRTASVVSSANAFEVNVGGGAITDATQVQSSISMVGGIWVKYGVEKPVLTSGLSKTICSGSLVNYTATSSTQNVSFSWTRAAVAGITQPAASGNGAYLNEQLTNTTAGPIDVIYVFTLTVSGATNTQNVKITVNPKPILTSTTITPICSGSNVFFTASSATSGTTFTWTRAAVAGISPSTGSGNNAYINEMLTNNTNSPINVTYVVSLLSNTCANTQNITVTVNPIPQLTSSLTHSMCSGNNVNYIATSNVANTTFSWTRAAVTGISQQASSGNNAYINEMLTNTTNSPINVTYVITMWANGCSRTQNITVRVDPKPVLSSALSKIICSGSSVNYTATSATQGVSFSWARAAVAGISPSTGSGNNAFINELLTNTTTSPIDVTYAITMWANNCSSTQNITIKVNPVPALTSSTAHTLYSGDTFAYIATSNIVGATFSWTRAAVTGILQPASSGNSAYINELLTNTTNKPIHVIYAITTSANGCSSTQNVIVTVDSKPVLSSDLSKIICSGSSVNYTATSSAPNVSFSWTRAAVAGITQQASSGNNGNITEQLTNTTPNPIDVIYVFTLAASGVTNTQNVKITVNPKPTLTSITLNPICSGSSVNFTAGSATSGTTFSWTRAAVTGISPSTGSGYGASISEILTNSSTNPIDVTYAIHLDANGCVNDQNVTVKVNPVPTLTSSTIYEKYSGETFTYTATSNLANTAFNWTRAAVSGITPSTGSGSDAFVNETLTSTETGLKEVVYAFNLTAFGCSNTQNVKVNVLKLPPYIDQYMACLNNELIMSVPPISGVSFYWYDSPSGGTPLSGSPANTITVVNQTLPKTYWVEPRTGTTTFKRKEITVTESEACGGTHLDTACMRKGTLLYSQDFGGNIPPVASFNSSPLPSECSELPYKTQNFAGGGFYTLTKNARFVWETFHNLGDHTHLGDTSLGFFMLVDPANGDKGKVLYKTTIYDLCDETTLTFSAWFMDVNNEKHVTPKIEMQMLNVNTGAVLATTGDIQIPYGNSWKQFGFNFKLPIGIDAVTLRILNKENSTTGNDWGMDDIKIHLCVPEVELHVDKEITSCIYSPLALSGSYNDDGTLGNQLDYQWEFSETGNVNNPEEWSVVDGTQGNVSNGKVTSSYYISALSLSDAGYYRLAVGRQGNINKRCRSESDIVKLLVKGFEMENISGEKKICVSSSISLTHSMPNGIWASSNTAVANISNSGVVTGVSAGETTITYTVQQEECQGIASMLITVHPLPEAGTISGENSVCVNNTIVMTPTVSGGNWTTSDINTATVDNAGIVTGVHEGNAKITYTIATLNGCTDTVSKTITVLPIPNLGYIEAPASICVGDTITMRMLKNGFTGYWASSDPEIAYIDEVTGKISGVDEGTVEIKYIATNGLCVDSVVTLLTVNFCIDCHEGGMLLYKQDFGGNDPFDPSPSPFGLSNVFSQLAYSTTSTHPQEKGYYNFTKNPVEIYPDGFFDRDDHTHEGDHTRGYMMFVDPYLNDFNKILYQTEIPDLCEGVRLYFSAWFTDINQHVHLNAKSPKIELQILDNVTEQILFSTGIKEIPFGNKWTQIGIPFTLGSNTHGIICRIYNKEASKDGNDLGIDDIEVRFCAPIVITSPSTTECEGEPLTMTGHYIDNGTFGKTLIYYWEYSETGNLKDPSAWTIIEESKGTVTNGRIEDIPYTIDFLSKADAGYYRFAVGCPITISSWNCRALSEPIEISVKGCAVVRGTVFPFFYYNYPELDTLFPVVARLYDISLIQRNPASIINEEQPLYMDTAVYYDGKIFIPNTPKFPGYLGHLNNPGFPIKWKRLWDINIETNNETLLEGEKPKTPIGWFQFDEVGHGDYILALTKGGYVTRFALVTVNNNNFSVGHRELIPGDLNGDLSVSSADLSILLSNFAAYGEENYNPDFDLNGDLSVNMADVSLLKFYMNFISFFYGDTETCFSSSKSMINLFKEFLNNNK